MEGLLHFGQTALGMIRDVLPIAAILIGFQLFILRRPIHNPMRVGVGLIMVLLGLALFLEGLELALFPLGRLMANQLTAPSFLFGPGADAVEAFEWSDFLWVYLFAGAIGFATTVAEPALIAVSIKANQVSGGTITVNGLRFAVAVGVALGVSLGAFRIVTGTPLHWYIITGYIVVIIQTEQLLVQIHGLVVDGVILLGAVRGLHDRHARPVPVEHFGPGALEDLGRQHRRTGTEIEDSGHD